MYFLFYATKTYLCPSYKWFKPAASSWPTRPVTYKHSQDMKLWTLSWYYASPLYSGPMSYQCLIKPLYGLKGWYVNSVKCFIPQSWETYVSTLAPYLAPTVITSHRTALSKNVLMLQHPNLTNPHNLKSGSLKIHNWSQISHFDFLHLSPDQDCYKQHFQQTNSAHSLPQLCLLQILYQGPNLSP